MPYHSDTLSLAQKSQLIQHLVQNPRLNQVQLAEWAQQKFHLSKPPSQPTISRILKRRPEFTEIPKQDRDLKRARHARFEILDRTLANWVLQRQGNAIALTGDLIKQEGKDFAIQQELDDPPKFSNGWLHTFKSRHGLRQIRMHGEAGSAAPVTAIQMETL